MELDVFENENISILENHKINDNLKEILSMHTIKNLKLINEEFRNDFINLLNCPNNLLLQTGFNKLFIKSNDNNFFISKYKDNLGLSKKINTNDCIKESLEIFKKDRIIDISNFVPTTRIKQNGDLEIKLKINYNATLERYLNNFIYDLKNIKNNLPMKIDKNKYNLKILNQNINFMFNDNINNTNVFYNKLSKLKSQYEQIKYLEILMNSKKIIIK